MADEHTRRIHGLLKSFVTALQRGDDITACQACTALAFEAMAQKSAEAAAGPLGSRSSSARPPAQLPRDLLDACVVLLQKPGATGSTSAFIMEALNAATKACGAENAAIMLLGNARFLRAAGARVRLVLG